MPYATDRLTSPEWRDLRAVRGTGNISIGRLRHGMTIEKAQAELDVALRSE